MGKYVCTICGYVYDEAKGIPEAGIAPGTAWEDIPEDWVCPLCAATKAEFSHQVDSIDSVKEKPISIMEEPKKLEELSPLEISTICSNLARGCEKQYKLKEAALFTELAEYFKSKSTPPEDANLDELIKSVEKDLSERFPTTKAVAEEAKDRGAMRALVWSEKVTRILKSLLSRYQKEGEALLKDNNVYVCTICGFVYIGDKTPELCPICKVQNWKFEEVRGGHVNV